MTAKSHKQVVDEYLCATNMRREQKLGVNLDHMQLPTMCEADGQVISGLWVWLESIIKDSPVEVQSRLDHGLILILPDNGSLINQE